MEDSARRIRLTHPRPNKADCAFVLGDTRFEFNKALFLCHSDLRNNKNFVFSGEIQVKLNVTPDSLEQFVRAGQEQEFDITKTNVNDLKLLAKEYQMPELIDEIKEFRRDNRSPILMVEDLKFNIKQLTTGESSLSESQNSQQHVKEIAELEKQIGEKILEFVDQPDCEQELLALEFPVLHQIISHTKPESSSIIFEFLLKCLEHFGPEASSLFTRIDFARLTPDQQRTLGPGISL
jgi:hypothetical protein